MLFYWCIKLFCLMFCVHCCVPNYLFSILFSNGTEWYGACVCTNLKSVLKWTVLNEVNAIRLTSILFKLFGAREKQKTEPNGTWALRKCRWNEAKIDMNAYNWCNATQRNHEENRQSFNITYTCHSYTLCSQRYHIEIQFKIFTSEFLQ